MLRFKVNIDPARVGQNLERTVRNVQAKIGLDLLTGIVLGTPVNTGRAAGNWQVTIGAPAEGTTEKTDPGRSATIADGSTVIGSAPAFTNVYITNNLPYIQALERGHSLQAPQGMVQINVDRVVGVFG